MPVTGPSAAQAAPLSEAELRAAVSGAGRLWADVRVLAQTGSTNSDVLERARRGAPEGLVIAAEAQLAGRGRQGRTWHSLAGAALTFSVLLRPSAVPAAARGWVPLLAGVGAAGALRKITAVEARLKWPNDIVVADGKLAGILAEQAGDAIAVGIGINVLGGEEDLPVASATSLELHGAGDADRTQLLAAVLAEVEGWYRRWCATGTGSADACGLRAEYLRLSASVGRRLQVQLPGGRDLVGVGVDVDGTGRLVVRPDGGDPGGDDLGGDDLVAITAGDVIHVR